MKKAHLLTKPTRIQDIDFDELVEEYDPRASERAERFRVRSYRKLRLPET